MSLKSIESDVDLSLESGIWNLSSFTYHMEVLKKALIKIEELDSQFAEEFKVGRPFIRKCVKQATKFTFLAESYPLRKEDDIVKIRNALDSTEACLNFALFILTHNEGYVETYVSYQYKSFGVFITAVLHRVAHMKRMMRRVPKYGLPETKTFLRLLQRMARDFIVIFCNMR